MKHVLFVIDTLLMGGAEKSLVSLLNSLDPQRVQVDLLVFEGGGVLQKDVPDWVHIIEADPVTRGMTLELRKYFKDLVKKGKFLAAGSRILMSINAKKNNTHGKPNFSWDAVCRHVPKLPGHYDTAVGYLEGFPDFYVIDKVDADKKIGWIHIDMTKRFPAPQETAYYESFDAIATISDICRDAFTTHFPRVKDRIRIIENVVLSEEVYHKADVSINVAWDENRIHLVTVGRLDYQKGIDVAARACKVLKDQGLYVCWHVYGKGIMHDEIMQYVKENDLSEEFILEGMNPNPYPYMKKANLLVQPSRWEGNSIVLDEAKILGKAIVVTNYPSVHDQIENGVTGVITGMEPEQIAAGIRKVLENPDLKKQLENNCLQEPNRSIRAVDAFYEMIGA